MARTTGALNLRTQETMSRVQAVCQEKGLDVFAVMADIVLTGKLKGERTRLPPDQRLMILKEITQYAFPKLSAIKHIIDIDDNQITIEWNQGQLFEDKPIEGEVIN